MNRIFTTLLSTIQSKVMSLWTKIRLWTSRSYWENKGITSLRQFFNRLLNIRPKDKTDYYPFLSWLVSKRLAFALVVVIGLLSLFYIFVFSPVSGTLFSESATVPTFRYNSIPLKFYSGEVQILAADGHVAYVGNVEDAAAVGSGSLYRPDGSLLYTGEFSDSRYNGQGSLYYQDGVLQYQGAFVDNLYQGQGKLYRQSGVLEYEGEFLKGQKSGAGVLYNSGGNTIFTGNFLADRLLYSEFLGKTTSQVASMYSGSTSVYSTSGEHCVSMDEINAVYTADDGSDTLSEEWTLTEILVQDSVFPTTQGEIASINDLTAYFGEPVYFGYTWPTLTEAVAVRNMSAAGQGRFAEIDMEMTSSFRDVYTVSSYDPNYEFYIYVYEMDGLTYTFYCDSSTSSFSMYAISLSTAQESAGEGGE